MARFDRDRDPHDTWRHREQYEGRERWGPRRTAWRQSPNVPYSGEGMPSGWGTEQTRYGGIGGYSPLGDWDYRDLGGSGRGYSGPEPDEGPYRGVAPKGWVRSNASLHEDLAERMADDPWLDARNIEIEVDAGEVTLRGTVDSREQKRIADHIAHRIPGVRDVHNRLTLKGRARRNPASNVEPTNT